MNYQSAHFLFQPFKLDEILHFVSQRNGETKLGQQLASLETAKYVIIGVEESIGPRANQGRSGAENGFKAFLNAFLNMQSNVTLSGENIHVLGGVKVKKENNNNLKEMTQELDEFLGTVLSLYIKEHQIPIVIGGGHNNAYPLIKFSCERKAAPIQVVNVDAHADYRLLEGRHSGNSFSYAFHEGYMKKYTVLGLHQRYNSQQILDDLKRDNHFFTFHESYLSGERDYLEDFNTLKNKLSGTNDFVGIELDMDTIENMPSSAFSPVGISIETARLFLVQMAGIENIAYLHLPEAAPTNELENRIVGKTLAYFVSDFIRVHG